MAQIGKEMHFCRSEELEEISSRILKDVQTRIVNVVSEAQVLHIGSGAIPGAYTKGDLDVQVRIAREDYLRATAALGDVFQADNPELWDGELAVFRDTSRYQCKVDILLTVIGSKDDDGFRLRDLLIASPELLAEYNTLKLRFEGGDFKEYKRLKDLFYAKLKRLISS